MTENRTDTSQIRVGVVGTGLMGSSIVVALLLAGHPVVALTPLPTDVASAPARIRQQLAHCQASGLLQKPVDAYWQQLILSENYDDLAHCLLILECVVEQLPVKEGVYRQIEATVAPDAIIATNTSAIPISLLQQYLKHPARFLGIHWAEPAYMTRFLEITCGEKTISERADWVFALAHSWQKEPTLLRRDIRGFVTNRLMYAVYREALHLVESGGATLEAADKAFRYDTGSWMTLMGIFRRLDYVGLDDYPAIFQTIFPLLSNAETVPPRMRELMAMKARGTQTEQGLYDYTGQEAREWDAAFARYNEEIFRLAARYPSGNDPHRT
ncbi:3-hydroxyacyl-CoA dehydrogenase family protein [Spirosoma arcticum]